MCDTAIVLRLPKLFIVRLPNSYAAILEDDSINCVIELMGGVTHAKDVVFKAIAKGKHVITANKALLAQYLPEVQQLLAANPKVKLGYEAAVCGGIPIINALQQDYLGDDITKVSS
jgi:homoserine dehydrogenase